MGTYRRNVDKIIAHVRELVEGPLAHLLVTSPLLTPPLPSASLTTTSPATSLWRLGGVWGARVVTVSIHPVEHRPGFTEGQRSPNGVEVVYGEGDEARGAEVRARNFTCHLTARGAITVTHTTIIQPLTGDRHKIARQVFAWREWLRWGLVEALERRCC